MALSYDNITEKYYEGETMQQNQWIVDEMNQVYKQGIRVDVNGLSYNPKTSANLMSGHRNSHPIRRCAVKKQKTGRKKRGAAKKIKKNNFFATFPLFESSYWYKGVRKSPKQ